MAIAAVAVGCNSNPDHDANNATSTIEVDGAQWQREQTSWALQAVDGSQLKIVAAVGGDPDCERFGTTEVIEHDDEVEIRAFSLVRVPAANEELICEASAKLEPESVQLEAPLGDRALTGCVTSRPIDSILARTACSDIQPQL